MSDYMPEWVRKAVKKEVSGKYEVFYSDGTSEILDLNEVELDAINEDIGNGIVKTVKVGTIKPVEKKAEPELIGISVIKEKGDNPIKCDVCKTDKDECTCGKFNKKAGKEEGDAKFQQGKSDFKGNVPESDWKSLEDIIHSMSSSELEKAIEMINKEKKFSDTAIEEGFEEKKAEVKPIADKKASTKKKAYRESIILRLSDFKPEFEDGMRDWINGVLAQGDPEKGDLAPSDDEDFTFEVELVKGSIDI